MLEFKSSYKNEDKLKINEHVSIHGDGVKDIAFEVEDTRKVFEIAKKNGAVVVKEPYKLEDEDGHVWLATVETYGDTTHTFVERKNYKGVYLPGYKKHHLKESFNTFLPEIKLDFVDHIVGNQPEKQMDIVVEWYLKKLYFHRFWSVDDSIMHTKYSALSSTVLADYDENIKMPINEPAKG